MAGRRTPEISGNPAPESMFRRVLKNFRLFFALSTVFFLPPCFLTGQELPPPESGGSFYIERTEGKERFIQRLVWEKIDFVHRYEIVIETESGSGEYAEIHREFRTENFIDLSLVPGLYRYRIQVYNLLNQPAGLSGWIPFQILPALQPELLSFRQKFLSGQKMAVTLYGKNLVEGAELYLQSLETGEPLTPLKLRLSEESARLVFDTPLAPGPYRASVKNPGGLESSLEILIAGSEDSGRSLYVTASYSPLIPLYGYVFEELDKAFYPGGVSARIGFVPLKRPWGDLGLELVPSWNMLKTGDIKIHMGTLHLNGLYQWWFPERMKVLIIRSGAGINLINGTNSENDQSISTWIFSLDGGIAFRWFIPRIENFRWTAHKTFYFEVGLDYTHIFATDTPQPGYIRPSLGVGAQF